MVDGRILLNDQRSTINHSFVENELAGFGQPQSVDFAVMLDQQLVPPLEEVVRGDGSGWGDGGFADGFRRLRRVGSLF